MSRWRRVGPIHITLSWLWLVALLGGCGLDSETNLAIFDPSRTTSNPFGRLVAAWDDGTSDASQMGEEAVELHVATPWGPDERDRLALAVSQQLDQLRRTSTPPPIRAIRWRWITIAQPSASTWTRLARLGPGRRPDLVLGLDPDSARLLGDRGLIHAASPIGKAFRSPPWQWPRLDLQANTAIRIPVPDPRLDPRRVPAVRQWMLDHLAVEGWDQGRRTLFDRLIDSTVKAPSDQTPELPRDPPSQTWIQPQNSPISHDLLAASSPFGLAQWVGVVKRTRPDEPVSDRGQPDSLKDQALALVLQTLKTEEHPTLQATRSSERSTDQREPVAERVRRQTDDLTIDLLVATLFDPAPLWLVALEKKAGPASSATDSSSSPANGQSTGRAAQVGWMSGPPWPPETIARMLANPASRPALEVWLRRITPDDRAGAWLLASWQRPARPVDRDLLAEIAAARDGALVEDSRFRAWLRAEWSAWAVRRAREGSQ